MSERWAREIGQEAALGAVTAHNSPPGWPPAPPWDAWGSRCVRLSRPAPSPFSYLPNTPLGRALPRREQGAGGE